MRSRSCARKTHSPNCRQTKINTTKKEGGEIMLSVTILAFLSVLLHIIDPFGILNIIF